MIYACSYKKLTGYNGDASGIFFFNRWSKNTFEISNSGRMIIYLHNKHTAFTLYIHLLLLLVGTDRALEVTTQLSPNVTLVTSAEI